MELTASEKNEFFKQGVFDIAMRLRMSKNGSGDSLSPEEEEKAKAYLKWRLSTWVPSVPWAREVDECAKEFLKAVLHEIDRKWSKRQNKCKTEK